MVDRRGFLGALVSVIAAPRALLERVKSDPYWTIGGVKYGTIIGHVQPPRGTGLIGAPEYIMPPGAIAASNNVLTVRVPDFALPRVLPSRSGLDALLRRLRRMGSLPKLPNGVGPAIHDDNLPRYA